MIATYTLTMAQSVGERLLDPDMSGGVTVSEMMDALGAVELAHRAGEIDGNTSKTFSEFIKQVLITRMRMSPEGHQELAAWMAIEEAELALPRTAVSQAVN